MKSNNSYMDRALRSRDPRFARVLSRLGYSRRDMQPAEQAGNDVRALREEYERVLGKKPFMGWDAETLRQKILAAPSTASSESSET